MSYANFFLLDIFEKITHFENEVTENNTVLPYNNAAKM